MPIRWSEIVEVRGYKNSYVGKDDKKRMGKMTGKMRKKRNERGGEHRER